MADYCDQCGAKIGGAPLVGGPAMQAPLVDPGPVVAAGPSEGGQPPDPAPVPPLPAGPPAAATEAPGGPGRTCPVCAMVRVADDRFCEGCGYDFTTAQALGPAPADGPATQAAWEAVVTADRAYYDRVAPDGVEFPSHCPSRHFLLAGDQIRIGRQSTSRGVQAEIDLSGAPEDTAISHLHSLLIEQADGSYSLIDPGSTNGTTLNDDPTPLAANIAVPIADGDQIHLGAWTTITVRARKPAAGRG
jgi:hypothetical protein